MAAAGRGSARDTACGDAQSEAPVPVLTGLFAGWVDAAQHREHANVTLLTERDGTRVSALDAICDAVDDHLLSVGDSVLSSLGFPRAAVIAAERLPRSKRIRSGDLAEILATEYVERHTEFEVPLKRLRHKDDREMSMRGDDIIALRRDGGKPRVLKGEVKSRVALTPSVVSEACDSLGASHGRPKAQTLGFIAHQLRHTRRDADAERVEDLMQANLGARDVAHFVFTMSENAPESRLAAVARPKTKVRDRRLVGLRVLGHQNFVQAVFDRMAARYAPDAQRNTGESTIAPAASAAETPVTAVLAAPTPIALLPDPPAEPTDAAVT